MLNSKQRENVIIVGAGISGLSAARLLQEHYSVTLLEKAKEPGGLIKCREVDGNLFHLVGGHVFNSKNQQVLEWFWQFFDKEREFRKAIRNAQIWLDKAYVGYPIENYLYQLPDHLVKLIITELLELQKISTPDQKARDFDDFLRKSFGQTLYKLYFGPYNRKIWNRDLCGIPLEWLAEKLPMPDIKQILLSNIYRQPENQMVHANFFYPAKGGSQFIINRLAEGLNIKTDTEIKTIATGTDNIILNDGAFTANILVYCGDIRKLGTILIHKDEELSVLLSSVSHLQTNGTTTALCYTDETEISWLYLPEDKYKAHRIIYTGNFSPENNRTGKRKTCVVEFSGLHEKEVVLKELKYLPGNLEFISLNQEPDSYLIHEPGTLDIMQKLQKKLAIYNIHLLGRFAEWRYYNMDKCIESAMHLTNKIVNG